MIRKIRLLLRENAILRVVVRPVLLWIVNDVFQYKQRLLHRYGYEAVRRLHACAKQVGMPYYADCGTLLGFIRDKGFIRHDVDMDFSMMPESGLVGSFYHALENAGFQFERFIVVDGRLREFSVRFKEISIDFLQRYFDLPDRTHFYIIGDQRGDFWSCAKRSAPNRLIPTTIRNVEVLIPDNYDTMLTEEYGKWSATVEQWDDLMSPGTLKDFGVHESRLSRDCGEWKRFLSEQKI